MNLETTEETNTKSKKSSSFAGKAISLASSDTGREILQIENTPFIIHKDENGDIYLVMGKYRLTEKLETVEEAMEWAQTPTWDKVITVTTCVMTAVNEINKLNEETNEN